MDEVQPSPWSAYPWIVTHKINELLSLYRSLLFWTLVKSQTNVTISIFFLKNLHSPFWPHHAACGIFFP